MSELLKPNPTLASLGAAASGANTDITSASPTKVTILAVDDSVDSALSVRQSNSITNGFDLLLDQLVDGAMTLNRISSGSSTTALTVGRVTPGFTFADKIIPSAGITGTSTNNNATAGNVGEYASSLVAVGAPQSLSNGTAANITSISLTAGDWDVAGQVNFTETTSTVTARSAGISSTSATLPTDGSEGYCGVQSTATSETNTINLCRKQISLGSTTTIYLVGKANFSAGTCGGFGAITARRVR